MLKSRKRRTVWVWCIWTDSDGTPVNKDGEIATSKRHYCYSWEKQRRSEKWLQENPALWAPLEDGISEV